VTSFYGDPATQPGTATTSNNTLVRPAHDAIAAQITTASKMAALGDPFATGDYLRGLFDALAAVDALRFEVRPAALTAGWTVEDSWTGESLDHYRDHYRAQTRARRENQRNVVEQRAAVDEKAVAA
jgi:hypothetical protein